MYSQKRNCAASVLNSTYMFLWAIYIFPGSVLQQNRQIAHRHIMGKLGLRPRNSFSGNICFEFSVLCLCTLQCLSAKILFKSGLTFKITHQWDGRGQRRWRRYCRRWKGRHLGPETQELYKKAKTSGLKLLWSYLQLTVLGWIAEFWKIFFIKSEDGLFILRKSFLYANNLKNFFNAAVNA
jgi:hypothetical protein